MVGTDREEAMEVDRKRPSRSAATRRMHLTTGQPWRIVSEHSPTPSREVPKAIRAEEEEEEEEEEEALRGGKEGGRGGRVASCYAERITASLGNANVARRTTESVHTIRVGKLKERDVARAQRRATVGGAKLARILSTSRKCAR
jgi:hypothetical protein